jgi:hypothetical protein
MGKKIGRVIFGSRLFLGVGILVLLSIFAGCFKQNGSADLSRAIMADCRYDIDRFILDRLIENRIVMLGEGGQGADIYMSRVASLIDFWIDALGQDCAKHDSLPRRLFVILENDSVFAARFRSYFNSGNEKDLIAPIDFASNAMTISRLAFYSELRRLKLKVDSCSPKAETSDTIGLELVFPEKSMDPAAWSFARRDSFLVYEKDKFAAARVIECLEKNPDAKAIIFYGAESLNKRGSIKKAGDVVGQGYYLAHYLEERFGREGGVYTVKQSLISDLEENQAAFQSPRKTYAVDNRKIKNDYNRFVGSDAASDGLIVYLDAIPQERPLFYAKSQNMVDMIIENLNNPDRYSEDYYKAFLEQAMRYLIIISGSPLDSFDIDDSSSRSAAVGKWKRWRETTPLEIVEDIRGMALWRRILGQMDQSNGKSTNRYEYLIALAAGIKPWFDTLSLPMDRADAYREYLHYYRKPIVVENLIALLWVATDKEKARAMEILETETGQAYRTPEEWLGWWRREGFRLWET